MPETEFKDLISDKKFHSVLLKLDREKPRELKFRRYLDENYLNGVSRKESVLRLFDYVVSQGLLDCNNIINESNRVSKYELTKGKFHSRLELGGSEDKKSDEVVEENKSMGILKVDEMGTEVDGEDWNNI